MKLSKFLSQIDYFDGDHNSLSTITIVLNVGIIICLFLLVFAYLDKKFNSQKN